MWVPVPTAAGVYVTEQLAEVPVPDRAQLATLKLPLPLLVKLAVPVGVMFPVEVSATVAVQVLAWFTATMLGVQVTVVVVVRLSTVRAKSPELLLWMESPA